MKVLRYVLGSLLSFAALNAFGGGWYGMSGAPDVPKVWLLGSPFPDYFIPSVILFFVVGGSLLFAAWVVFARARIAQLAAFGAGMVLLVWIGVQVWMIGYVSWMQPTTAVTALLIVVLASLLHSSPRASR